MRYGVCHPARRYETISWKLYDGDEDGDGDYGDDNDGDDNDDNRLLSSNQNIYNTYNKRLSNEHKTSVFPGSRK